MRALIVDSNEERGELIRALLVEAGTKVDLLETWEDASSRLIKVKPDLCLVAFDLLLEDGLNSLLGADAQLKALQVPSVLVHSAEEASEVDAVRPLASFADTVELPREMDELEGRLEEIAPGIVGGEASEQGLADAFEAARRWEDPALLESGTLVDGRYEIAEFVAAGGMGYIYKALQQPLERPVALKVIRGELSQEEDAIARFRLEARTVSRLTHPHTIVLFDYGIDAHGLMYLAMEWLEGATLADYFDDGRIFEPLEAARIARQTAESLSEAHRKGIVHRDLKPGNIFLVTDQAEADFVKVLDFGIAKLMDNSTAAGITRVGTICGTPEYMSPEQARGEDLDGRSDIYALGCCLHAMLTGDPPFLEDQPLQVIMRHQSEPLPHPGEHVPDGLVAIIERATAKDVEARYEDATAFAAALDAFMENPEDSLELIPPVDTSAKTVLPDHVLSGDSSAPVSDASSGGSAGRSQTRLLRVPDLESGLLSTESIIRTLHLLAFQEKTGELTVRRRGQARTLQLVSGLVCREGVQAFLPAFGWQDGEWSFRDRSPAPGGTVEALQVIHDGLRLHGSVNELAMQLADKNDLYAVRTTLYQQNRVMWDALGQLAEVFALCDGETRVSSLISSGIDFSVVTRALILGEETDAIVFLEEAQTAPLPVSYAIARSETRTLSVRARESLQRLQGAIDELTSSDPYSAFGLSPGCGESAVKDRFRGLEERYTGTDSQAPAVQRKKAELLDALRSARDQLLEGERESGQLSREEERVLEELDVKRAQFAGSDPYAAFQLWAGCGRNAIEDRFFELVNRHHPDQYATYGREEIKVAADDVFIELQKVYRLLLSREQTEEPTREKPGGSSTGRKRQGANTGRESSSSDSEPSSTSSRGFARQRNSDASNSGSATRVKVKLPSRPMTRSQIRQPVPPRDDSSDVSRTRVETPSAGSGGDRSRRVAPSAPPKRSESGTRVPTTDSSQGSSSHSQTTHSQTTSQQTLRSGGRRKRKMSEILAERANRDQERDGVGKGGGSGPEDVIQEESQPRLEAPRARRSRPDLSALRAAKSPGEHSRQGARFLEQNNLEAARRAFEAAFELDPENFSHAAHLAWIDYLCDPQQVSRVVERLKGMRKKRGGREANYYLGKISFKEGELSSARRFYESTLRDNEAHVGARRELRLVKMRLEEETKEKNTGLFNRLVKKVKSKLE